MLLQLRNIKKYFPVKKGFLGKTEALVRAVNDVSLTVPKGENVSLVGESGCGKTTLARIIMQLYAPDGGSVVFDGHDMTGGPKGDSGKFKKDIQMVFQDPYSSLDPRFSIRRIMEESMTLAQSEHKTRKDKEERMRELLTAVNLGGDILNRYPHEFSGGERQRIAIARALVLNPKLLILDEAVSSLDVLIQDQLINLLSDLKKQYNLTYLFISHNLKVVKKISQKIAVMYKGRIVELASSEGLFHSPFHSYTKELLAAAIDYKAIRRAREIEIREEAQLIDKGYGHYVLEE